MLTYTLKKQPGVPLYEALYRCVRADILAGNLQPGQKLPSKRALAAHLEVSKITVEAAYEQLLAEGYIYAREKVGYFVEKTEKPLPVSLPETAAPVADKTQTVDLTGNGTTDFPFSVWSRLQRQVMLDLGQSLLQPIHNQGVLELRRAICRHLADFRGMQVAPENVLVGAGTDFLYNLLIQLLGREKVYAVEEPGYGKIRALYAAAGAACVDAPMDSSGVLPHVQADVLHISPSHHFPTGLVTPMQRRRELLSWVQQPGRYLIEDDYDSEFRFNAHPMPTLASMDTAGRVIYMNTFSKTLAPSIRISYMVLPAGLMAQFREKLGFYSCTVPSFEQHTLARFLAGGWFEKHINRLRKSYRQRRNRLLDLLAKCPYASRFTIQEQDAGLHFLLRVKTELSDAALAEKILQMGIRVRLLSSYYHGGGAEQGCLVVNYSGLEERQLAQLEEILG